MTWTIYKLADGAVVLDGWPVDPSDPESGVAFDPAVHGAVESASSDAHMDEWDSENLVWRRSPSKARAQRWEEAKEYYLVALNFGFVLPDIGWVQTNTESREAIRTLYDDAMEALDAGDVWATRFKNLNNDRIPVTAEEVVMVYRELRIFLGLCVKARDDIEDAIKAAYNAGATAEQILAIPIDVGYP